MRYFLFFILFPVFAGAQIDSAVSVPMVMVHAGAQLPGGDLAKRFGPNLAAGGTFLYKTKSNWLVGIQSAYGFGKNVREDVLSQMRSGNGMVIDNEGFPADLRVNERVLYGHVLAGRVFRFLSANPNSGLLVYAGGGYMQHRIHLYDAQQKIAAVRGELAYGYDRMSTGFSTTQFLGYMFLSENRLLNLYFGFECVQGFTKSIRKMNYDTGMPDTEQRLDVLYGLRFGWILPLYKRKPYDFYYN